MLEVIHTDKGPAAIGPYSQAIKAGGFVYVSGQLPFVPETGELLEGTVAQKCAQAAKNIAAILEAAGSGMDKVVKTTVFLTDLADFAEVNAGNGLKVPRWMRPYMTYVLPLVILVVLVMSLF